MEIKEYRARGCCGSTSLFYKISEPIDQELANKFIELGLVQEEHYKKSGILYVHNSDFIVTGPFGSNRIQFKCKQSGCDEHQNTLINILKDF